MRSRAGVILLAALSVNATVEAQKQTAAQTPPPLQPTSQVKCLPVNQDLPKIPELISSGGRLRATITLISEKNRIGERNPVTTVIGTQTKSVQPSQPFNPKGKPPTAAFQACYPQWVRAFRSPEAVPPYAVVPEGEMGDPMPGPTLRARVGDMIELTFLNNVDPAVFNRSQDGGADIDRGDRQQCDESSFGYPFVDKYPNCFHGSTSANIHFHGTHTNPNTTGDNVFLEILSSRRIKGAPPVKPSDVKPAFDEFFSRCETELATISYREWPRKWSDLPKSWTDSQMEKLRQFDAQPGTTRSLGKINERVLGYGAWPQYYIGSYPYCFRLPEYKSPAPPVTSDHETARMHEKHTGGAGRAETEGHAWSPFLTEDPPRLPLQMGQAPGTHWYHAHKHGSTALNVSNGMSGVFIIEGEYDDDLNEAYKAWGPQWTRKQPVLLINQLGTSPNLMKGPAQDRGPDFSVNGRTNPVIKMAPGEVQLWRMVNSSSRAGVQFLGPPPGFQWRQLAQDGVQFKTVNYLASANEPFFLAAGNRADFLVKAPDACGASCTVQVLNSVDPQHNSPYPIDLLTVKIVGPKVSPAMDFIPEAPTFPTFLEDIRDDAIRGTKIIDFDTVGGSGGLGGGTTPKTRRPAMHKIDGKQFDGDVGALVRLNTVEEWTVRNFTTDISHPFHIHINPFQVVEEFRPNDTLPGSVATATTPATPLYITNEALRKSPDQCYLDPAKPETWKTCRGKAGPQKDAIWWDVFPIPSGIGVLDDKGNPVNNADGTPVIIPGHFKMRSRFVDYAGFYVIHCHILAHEDRGMMTVVEVAPSQSPYSHH
ncbi:MAG TPA: multicopper oxidase domain-containing protein [Thermoanaerobaculia bacterium]|jgi:FtsP/CotA-like multicopper oxidase with cupredoxin domain